MTTELATLPAPNATSVSTARLLVILPAYNEAPRLAPVVAAVRELQSEADVLVVDDGSSDETSECARRAGARVATHPFNLGYGAALETGYRYALKRRYDLVVQMDADGQHQPTSLASLLEPILDNRADVVVGSRFLDPSHYRSTLPRRAGSVLFGKLASLATGRTITDPTSGLWAMNRLAVETLTSGALPHDYPDADVLIGMHRAGLRVAEVAVSMHSSPEKTSMHAGVRPLYYVYKMLLSMTLETIGRRPRRV
jgi:glycosyltransferase involved in cell wall biosynthesis